MGYFDIVIQVFAWIAAAAIWLGLFVLIAKGIICRYKRYRANDVKRKAEYEYSNS